MLHSTSRPPPPEFTSYADFASAWDIAALEQAAQRNDWLSCVRLGLALKHAHGVKADFKLARALFKRAADAGFAPGLNELGKLLADDQEVDKAMALFERAVDLELPDAAFNLGRCWTDERGETVR